MGSADGFVYRYDVVGGKLRRDFVASPVCSFWLGEGCVLIQSQDGHLRLLDSGMNDLKWYASEKYIELLNASARSPTSHTV